MKKILPFIFAIALLISLYVIKTQKDDKDEMLKSFQSIEASLNKSNENLNISSIYKLALIQEEARNRPEEVAPYYKRADKIKTTSDKFVDFIETIKNEIKKKIDNNEKPRDYYFLKKSDNIAKTITMKLDSTRSKLLNLTKDGEGVRVNQRDIEKIKNQTYFLTIYNSGRHSSWANRYLIHSTIQEKIALLTQLQNDFRNFEADIISVLARSIDRGCSFERLEAKVLPNAKMVKVGSKYQAEIFLHSSYDASIFEVIVNGNKLPLEEDKRIYSITPTKPGIHYLEGFIQVKGPRGITEYPFKEKFEAF